MQVKISDVVVDNFMESLNFMCQFLGISENDTEALAPFVKVQAALRAMSPEIYGEVAQPILAGIFEALGLDPKNPDDRKKAEPFVDVLALGLQDAVHLAMQAQAQHQKAAAALSAGQGALLRNS